MREAHRQLWRKRPEILPLGILNTHITNRTLQVKMCFLNYHNLKVFHIEIWIFVFCCKIGNSGNTGTGLFCGKISRSRGSSLWLGSSCRIVLTATHSPSIQSSSLFLLSAFFHREVNLSPMLSSCQNKSSNLRKPCVLFLLLFMPRPHEYIEALGSPDTSQSIMAPI